MVVAQTWVLLTVITALLLAGGAILMYSQIPFQTARSERPLIKSGILLLPLYGLLEFGAIPNSRVPVVVLFSVGAILAYAFHQFEASAPEEEEDVASTGAEEDIEGETA